ncbi:uncharacterized protein MONOS_7443 [Monocercomonoides exilis]|uniref:uncharacterized protein n=1 Tax=Monocercomonoides exilis TaxID=2049356 RepID=UPI003559E20B|nr:hypothetical protein MONOS_7443 [Monocercomonoides exilis]|eukprot:MONOS_7443.1-p1 / transcript=MONOS_7443.1 / gene=MONOS_7443 / organism=Monocercomonoides_exilis_PA203 / gene_product=unspecified product / transcript_product=unspecified product / location=Mono_scaffold00254:53079-61430(+) / protein_length=2689 / sequence_SO=supercontig / SO=protein_coding / is_pseudo=false
MSSCSFSSVCDVYDGGIVPSLNNPLASLTASNTTFIGCCRTRNVEHIGTENERKHPARQNKTDDGPNTFIWCEWNGSKTTGTSDSYSDGKSSGGAILNVNSRIAKQIVMEEGFIFILFMFQCKDALGKKKEKGRAHACSTAVSLRASSQIIMVEECIVQLFLPHHSKCGTFSFSHVQQHHMEVCLENTPCGHDIYYEDEHSLYLSSDNPFFECYTTNTDDRRVCYGYNYSSPESWTFQHTEKKVWLKDKTIYVSVNGSDASQFCGENTTHACLTVKKALKMCEVQISLAINLLEGNHQSETTTIDIGEKKISVIGKGRMESSIGTGALFSSGPLFSVSTGHLGLLHMKVDCNSNSSHSPSVVVVSDRNGSLSLEDVVITTSIFGRRTNAISSSVFVVPLSQLSMVGVEIINMNVSKSLFSEPDLSSPSSFSSSILYLTSATSGESTLANVTVQNVKLTSGDGVVVEKSVKEGETFVVQNVTIEDCESKNGSGGGIKVELETDTSKLRVERTTTIKRCASGKYGGGMMLYLADNSIDFSIVSVDFSGCSASSGGNYVFVNGSDSERWTITTEKLNVQHNNSKYNEIVGYDRSDTTMGLFPLNVFLDSYPSESHVGKVKDGLGGYDSWFCGFDYYPCATITHAAQTRHPDTNKKIELDSGFELAEEVTVNGSFEWDIFSSTNEKEVGVKAPEIFESSCLIEVLSKCSMRNIRFSIPFALSGASSLISSNSILIIFTDCSVVCPSENSIGYCFVNVVGGKVKVEGLVITETLTFGEHSLIEFTEGVKSVVFCGCDVNDIEKRNGDGGWLSGVVGAERDDGVNGIIVIESCIVKGCSCNGRGGGIRVVVKGEGGVVVNGSCAINGREAKSSGEREGGSEGRCEGRGGGIMIVMESRDSSLKIESGREGLFGENNKARYGKNLFVHCGRSVLLESKINSTSFSFFDSSFIRSDVLELCGSENGREEEVIPLFVYLCSIGSKLTVDGSGEVALDHSRCGFEKFGCETIDYCVEKRASINVNEIEIISESLIKNEMKVASFGVCISGKEEGTKVVARDEGSITQNNLIECTKSFDMMNLAFMLNEEMNGKRRTFIHSSSSTISMTSCSVLFANNELIGYNVICIEGGGLIVNGFVIEVGLRMNEKSPIVISNGVELEMNNSRMRGVKVTGGIGGGCLNVEMGVNGVANIEECNLSSVCSGGSGMKGGGTMVSVGKGGSLEMKNVNLSGCAVPSEDIDEVGRGIGGGMFVELPEEIGLFVLEGMEFEGCNAWKGKNMFVSGWDLSEIVNKEHLKWEMSSEELRLLDELCGWERKTTGEEGYVIPLVVFLWRNWSGDGFVSREKGGDFSWCGYSEAPCTSIDHLISLRYPTLGEGETHIAIVGSGFLSHSISFSSSFLSFSSSISESPKVVIEGTKKGTGVTISDEDENDLDNDSMISSNVSLSFVNVSFTKPSITTHHEVLIESSGTNTLLSVSDCSFGPGRGVAESFGYCVMRVNGGSVVIERCSLSLISELKGLIAFSPSAGEVIIQNVNISFAAVTERSLISMMEEESQMNEKENTHSYANDNRPVLRVVGCSFVNITNEGIGASVIEVGSFEHGVECVIDECSISNCKSDLSTEGGGMRATLKSEESVLKVNGSTLSMCRCSTDTGRGGGLFINGADPNVNYADETQIPRLRINIVNIMFYMNEAFVGNDIFIKCYSIEHQINETLFTLNYNQESLNSDNSICGCDSEIEGIKDLIPLITYFKGLQVFLNVGGEDGRRCGAQSSPCVSINCGVDHIQEGVMNAILIDEEGGVYGECVIGNLVVNSFKKTQAIVKFKSKIEKSTEKDCIMEFVNECSVERCSFQFEDGLESTHSYLMKVKNGSTKIQKCEFFSSAIELKMNSSIVSMESGELKISETTFRDIHSTRSVLSFCEESDVIIDEARISNIECEKDVVSVGGKAKVEMKEMMIENVTLASERCVVALEDHEQKVSVLNSSFGKCVNSVDKGSMMQIRQSKNVRIEACLFDGEKEKENFNEIKKRIEGLCKWNGSLVDIENGCVEMKETTIMRSKTGGLWVSGGGVKIEKGEFENNNPEIEGYPSARRNTICTGNGELNVASVKGGDGLKDNSSLWILDEGCQLGGIASERGSSYFVPVLEEVKNTTQASGSVDLNIRGKLLLPCNLSLKICMKNGDEEEIVREEIDEEGYISENEIHSIISSSELEKAKEETEVSVCILFGNGESPSSTRSFILKNASAPESKGDERIVEGGKEGKSKWTIIVIIVCVVCAILLVVIVALAVRWRKAKNEAEDLREIVNDNIRKDPKAFEMVTMEMSPEEQWRRAEREAEKKNEERIKKRVYEKSLGHSESSEHLLSESGSTEYILGRDSDKIPEWMLEKVDEKEVEEETRKRTPSPSISSTSTTDTSDTESTFVRGEDLCPTTSSMSNLVDAMACSSPHEKLIVDLRDSLFMLLHGRNEKKEMAIGSLEERELTAAQILFWVANLALHSFDETEIPLQSLSSLSPHIVLFSEHMVICVVMHSDFLSSDDSDSSSISSSTVVTSASDNDDDEDSLPSSAFEDEDDFKKECLRWKAPELLINKKMGATKESVAFSIGMMLWECLTLQIPFGEFEAEVAGQKIVNGERPDMSQTDGTTYNRLVRSSVAQNKDDRPSLFGMKREFFQRFPPGATIVTVSDAIDYTEETKIVCASLISNSP